jgi:hypothetical protein
VHLRELVNAPSQATNLTSPLKPGQSLAYGSTRVEVCELSGRKEPFAVLCSNSP